MWSWGCGADGQLGRGNHSCHDQCLPHQVATPMKREQREAEALGEGEQQEQHGEKAVQIAAGWNHSLALTAQGSVLCWGSSRFNQIGSLAGTAEPSPKESAPPAFVQLLPVPMAGIESHVKITAISAGLHHSALLTSTWAMASSVSLDTAIWPRALFPLSLIN